MNSQRMANVFRLSDVMLGARDMTIEIHAPSAISPAGALRVVEELGGKGTEPAQLFIKVV